MKKFVAIYYSTPESKAAFEALGEKEKQEIMASWGSWKERCGNQLIDLGAPLLPGQALDQIGALPDPNKSISGYSIVQAKDLEDAKLLFWEHPYANRGIQLLECAAV